jgi:hypothetical protein
MAREKLQGRRFGMLRVFMLVGVDKQGRHKYRCKCDCGNFCVASAQHLTRKELPKVSCGCVRKMKKLTHDGQTRSYEEWAAITGIPLALIYQRIKRDKRTVGDALTPGRLPYR